MARPRRRQVSPDRDYVQPLSTWSEVRRAQEDGARSAMSPVAHRTIKLTEPGIVLAGLCVLLVHGARSVLSAVAHRTIRLAELGILLAAAYAVLAAESVRSAVAHRTIRLPKLGVVPAAACILLVAAVRVATGGTPWSDRLSAGTPAIPAQSVAAIRVVAATSTPSFPTVEGFSQQSSDAQQPASGTATAQPLPTSVPRPTPTAMPLTVFIDPGHGGVDKGAVGVAEDGSFVCEKDVALALALRTADHLRADGIDVVLSRTDDSLPGATQSDYTSDGHQLTPDGLLADLQRRTERANASRAQVLLSIHFNGLNDPSVAGTATLYCGSRPFADKSRHFATLIQDTVIAALRAQGYTTPDQGVIDDEDLEAGSFGTLGESYNHLALLGPAVPGSLHASNMPGALFEAFYLSNPREASAATEPDTQDLIATALARAIEQYLKDERQQVSAVATAGPR